MAYPRDFIDAAHRHKQAADCLHDCEPSCRRRDVAGYLYGLAAECALKEIMRRSYNWSVAYEPADQDAFWSHFPHIKTGIRDMASGRYAAQLQKFATTVFMNEWDIAMRYAHKKHIPDALVARWRADAASVIRAMEDLG